MNLDSYLHTININNILSYSTCRTKNLKYVLIKTKTVNRTKHTTLA